MGSTFSFYVLSYIDEPNTSLAGDWKKIGFIGILTKERGPRPRDLLFAPEYYYIEKQGK